MTSRDFLQTLAYAQRASADRSWLEAIARWESVVEVSPVEGRFWLELATARENVHDFAGSIAALQHGLTLRAGYPSETAKSIARCHAQAGQPDDALDWLERAVRMGLRSLVDVREDVRFASIRADARFAGALGVDDTSGLSRDNGWRVDLRFLVREIERRAFSPFLIVTRERFAQIADEIEQAIPYTSDAGMVLALQRLVTLLGDGHARIRPPRGRADLQRVAPIQFYIFGEDLHITAAVPKHAEIVGNRVEAFAGTPVTEMMRAFQPLLPCDNGNQQWIKETLPPRLREIGTLHALGISPTEDRIQLTVTDAANATWDVVIDADPAYTADELREARPAPAGWSYLPDTLDAPRPDYLQNPALSYWFRTIPEHNMVYLQFNDVRDAPGETFASVCDRIFALLDEMPGACLVIDIRSNGGGNTALTHSLLYHVIQSPRINQRGRLYVIIGRRTFSAAQNLVGLLDRHTNAVFVGEPTGSSPMFVGESVEFELPYSRIVANVSDLHWVTTWPDDYRTWVAPTLFAPPTIAAFRENRDPAMEAILEDDRSFPLGSM